MVSKVTITGTPSAIDSEKRWKGVRKRAWGRWVCEIRLPRSRQRIWLGSYATPEEAACAYDAASLCLRGTTASLNFPNCSSTFSSLLSGGSSSQPLPWTREAIQSIAASAAAQWRNPQSVTMTERSYNSAWNESQLMPYVRPDWASAMKLKMKESWSASNGEESPPQLQMNGGAQVPQARDDTSFGAEEDQGFFSDVLKDLKELEPLPSIGDFHET